MLIKVVQVPQGMRKPFVFVFFKFHMLVDFPTFYHSQKDMPSYVMMPKHSSK